MESKPQTTEFRNNHENFHPCEPRHLKTCLRGFLKGVIQNSPLSYRDYLGGSGWGVWYSLFIKNLVYYHLI